MAGMKLSELDFLRLLPVFMRDDEAVIALSKAMNKLMGEPGKRLSTIRTWDKIDELNEAECDELAWELDIDWYDSDGMSLQEKQETIKMVQQIKRKRGTKWAVERLISAYFGDGYVLEWCEPGPGDTICGAAIVGSAAVSGYKRVPFTFSVMTTNPNISSTNYTKFVEAVKAAKNERSHISGIYYYWEQGADHGVECALDSSLHRYDFAQCGTHDRAATVGFLVKCDGIETEPEATLHRYEYHRCDGVTKCGGDGIKSRIAFVGAAVVGTDRAIYAPDDNMHTANLGTCVLGNMILGLA